MKISFDIFKELLRQSWGRQTKINYFNIERLKGFNWNFQSQWVNEWIELSSALILAFKEIFKKNPISRSLHKSSSLKEVLISIINKAPGRPANKASCLFALLQPVKINWFSLGLFVFNRSRRRRHLRAACYRRLSAFIYTMLTLLERRAAVNFQKDVENLFSDIELGMRKKNAKWNAEASS